MRVRQLNTLLPIEVAVTGRVGPRACTAYGRRQAVHTIVRVCAECKDADLE